MKTSYKIKRMIKRIYYRCLHWKHYRKARQKLSPLSESYADYLSIQLERTIIKNDNKLKDRTIYLIEKLEKFVNLNHLRILCVGCRNQTELKYFYSKRAKEVVGIDLMSNHPNIMVMDMHEMTFPDNSFDVVFSSHSLEHAYNPQKVIGEITRVCRTGGYVVVEVPIHFKTNFADRIDFGDTKKLLSAFSTNISQVLLNEEELHPNKGTDVARIIIQLK